MKEDKIKRIFYYDIAIYYSMDCSDRRVDANGNLVDSPLNKDAQDNLSSSYTRKGGSHGNCSNSVDGSSSVPSYPKHAISYMSTASEVLADINGTGYIEKYYSDPNCDASSFMGANWFSQENCHNNLSPNSISQSESFQFKKVDATNGISSVKLQKFSDENCNSEIVMSDPNFFVQKPIISFDETICSVVDVSKYDSGIIASGNYYFQSGTVTALGDTDSYAPTSTPTFISEEWTEGGQTTWSRRRTRKVGLCENLCSGHGICEVNQNCVCYEGLHGEPEWIGPGDSLYSCSVQNYMM